MTNDEIRALVADCRSHEHIQHWHALHLLTTIETLLAREAEVLTVFCGSKPLPFCRYCDEYKDQTGHECMHCFCALDESSLMLCKIYTILNPQPAAMAEENDNGN